MLRLKSLYLGYGIDFHDLRREPERIVSEESLRFLDGLLAIDDLEEIGMPNNSGVEGSHDYHVYPKYLLLQAPKLHTITLADISIARGSAYYFARHLAQFMPSNEIGLRLGGAPENTLQDFIVYAAIASKEAPKLQHLLIQARPGTVAFENQDDQEYLELRGCDWIKTLGFQVMDNLPREWLLDSVCGMLSTLTALEALWLASDDWPEYNDLEQLLLHVARACPRLTYLRLQAQGYRIHRSTTSRNPEDRGSQIENVAIEALGREEDEFEGPSIFLVPYPLPFSNVVEHTDI